MGVGLGFGAADIVRFKHTADRMMAKARQRVAKTDEVIEAGINTVEVGAAAFAFGLAQGKWGGIAIVGVPIDLLAGIAGHLAAFMGFGSSKYASHIHAFADGALASFFNGLGRQVGRQIQTPEDRARISGMSGDGTTGGASLADEELARMVAAGRRP